MRKFLIALLLVPAVLSAQRPARATMRTVVRSVNALADSAHYKVEFGSDVNVSQTGDSLPGLVRVGYILGNTFTVEARGSAQKDNSYLEADLALSLTAAVFPGATSVHGQYVEAGLAYRYEGGAFQYGLSIGTGTRAIATNGIAARIGAFSQYLLPRNGIPGSTTVGARVGISFWR